MNKKKIALLLGLAALLVAFFALDLGRFLSLDYLKSSQARFDALYQTSPWTVVGVYFAIYVLVTALSFPGAVILTLAGGAIFGLGWGLLIVSFASSVGATLAFFAARFMLRDSLEARFGARLAEFNRGVAKEGAFYLFTLRLVPLVPFFVINLLMGLTQMKARTFYWVSQLGMAGGHGGVCECRHATGAARFIKGHFEPGFAGLFCAAGAVSAAGAQSHRRAQAPPGLRALAAPETQNFRSQPDRHWRGRRWPGV